MIFVVSVWNIVMFGMMKKMNKRDYITLGLLGCLIVMWNMDITPSEFLYLIRTTLPNYIMYKMG